MVIRNYCSAVHTGLLALQGEDELGHYIRTHLKKLQVDTSFIKGETLLCWYLQLLQYTCERRDLFRVHGTVIRASPIVNCRTLYTHEVLQIHLIYTSYIAAAIVL